MTKCYKVKTKRSICSNGGYKYSVLTYNLKIIRLDINLKEMRTFNVDDFIIVEDNKLIKVIPSKVKNSYKKSKKAQIKK
jgi:hypothetical protein